MSRESREARARARGDAPVGVALPALAAVCAGLVAAVCVGAAMTPGAVWTHALAAADDPHVAWDAGRQALSLALGALLGVPFAAALAAVFVARAVGGAPVRPRWRWRPAAGSKATAWAAVIALAATALLTPLALNALVPGADPGKAWLLAPFVAVAVGAVCAAPIALLDGAWALAAWRRRVHPDPPPRRSDDAPAPEVTAALRDGLSASASPPEAP